MMTRNLVAVLLGAVIACGGSPANAAEALLRITCPDQWPGPDHRGVRLSYSTAWYDSRAMFGEWEHLVPPDDERSALLDCAYGGAAPGSRFRGGAFSDLRMTVQIPGRARRCTGGVAGPPSSWCDTAPEADGTIGPIRIHLAQRPTLATTLLGFGLRRSVDEILAAAAAGGFTCSQESGTLHCASAHDRIDAVVRDGHSVAVRWLLPRDKSGQGGAYDRTVFRFGLNRGRAFDVPGEPDLWQEPKSPVRVTFAYNRDPMVLTLEDVTGRSPAAAPN